MSTLEGRQNVPAAPPAGDEDAPVATAIELTRLVKTFGAKRAVDGVDLTIRPGEVVALLGPNGAGKSTTIEMLLGLTTPTEGSARLFGRTPRQAVAAGSVGAMMQSGGFLGDMTAREIVSVVAHQYPSPLSVTEALERAGAEDFAKQKFSGLSGGQKQRVRFATALACDPHLLVLDEPTVAMDVEGRRDFWAAMREFTSGGRTVVFATHYLAEAEDFADRLVLLREGSVIADGSMTHIRSQVSGRTVRATVPDLDLATLSSLPGVTEAILEDGRAELQCTDSDGTLRAMFAASAAVHDVEVTTADLEDAFLALTQKET